MISRLVDEVLSGDRVVFSFASIWVFAITLWITLDALGNPNRGRFRPRGTRHHGSRREQREAGRRRRAEDDAAVRATLRDAYGASSLRVGWTRAREAEALEADEFLVRREHRVRPAPIRALLPWFEDEFQREEPLLATDRDDPTFVAVAPMPRGRWRRGDDPLMLSPAGKPPTAATVRSRVWKNHAGQEAWGATNQERMQAGKPPRRYNPLTGVTETASVDLRAAQPSWRPVGVDPFASAHSETHTEPVP